MVSSIVLRLSILLISSVLLAACDASKYDASHVAESAGQTRIRSIILHYTQVGDARSLELLTSSEYPVSSHYLLSSSDPKKGPKIYQLVDDTGRAWHAGRSGWRGRENLNDTSIGIEIVYQISCTDPMLSSYDSCYFPDFNLEQMDKLVELLEDLKKKYPEIEPLGFAGHSDIAPTRKIDPGPRFPWHYLHTKGFGAWYDDKTAQRYYTFFLKEAPTTQQIAEALWDIGYHFELTNEERFGDLYTPQPSDQNSTLFATLNAPSNVSPQNADKEKPEEVLEPAQEAIKENLVDTEKEEEEEEDSEFTHVIRAFQAHFVPQNITGEPDTLTLGALFALREKYESQSTAHKSFCAESPSCATDLPVGSSN